MKRITKKDREILASKFGGRCAYCGCELKKGWHADHIEPVRRELAYGRTGITSVNKATEEGRHVIENMNPSCPSCNISKGSMPLEIWREWIAGHVNSLNQYSKNYRMAKAYGLVTETQNSVVFYYEKHSSGNVT